MGPSVVLRRARQVYNEAIKPAEEAYETCFCLPVAKIFDFQPVVGRNISRLQYCAPEFVVSLGVLVDPALPDANGEGGEPSQQETKQELDAI